MNHNSPENLVDFKTLNTFLAEKASKDDLEMRLEGKSNIKDTTFNLNTSTTIHNQLKNIGILVLEILRKDYLNFTETPKTKNCARREAKQILNQASTVVQWINGFKPEDSS